MADPRSTAPSTVPVARLQRARTVRRAFFVAICLVLVAAALGRLGVHTRTVSATGGGWTLSVTYDDLTRSGLAANLSIEIRRTGGLPFPATVDLAVASAYGDQFDVNGVDPQPAEAWSTRDRLVQRFRPPPTGDVMTVSVDARVQPGVQWKRVRGAVAVLDESGRDAVAVRLSTLVMP